MLALTFSVGPLRFAIPSRSIIQIVPRVPLRQVAGVGAEIAGLLELGTGVVPVADLGMLLRGTSCEDRLSTRIIVVQLNHGGQARELGLVAEQVTDLCEVDGKGHDARDLGAGKPPNSGSEPRALGDALGTVARAGGALVQWLDVDRILTVEQFTRVFGIIPASRT